MKNQSENKLLKNLIRVYTHVFDNVYSDMYRRLYCRSGKKHLLTSLKDWEDNIPFLSKEELISFSYKERIFVPPQEITDVRCTSGTSGNKPLVIPRISSNYHYNLAFDKNKSPTGLLVFFFPLFRYECGIADVHQDTFPIISMDYRNLEESVRFSAQVGIDHLAGFVFMIEKLYPLLEKYKLLEKIVRVEIYGECTSDEEWTELQVKFPNAHIRASYAAAEFQGLAGYQPIGTTYPNGVYLPAPDFYIELIDSNQTVIKDTFIEGELVVTNLNLSSSPTPLLRYRTGDRGIYTYTNPNDHTKSSFKVLGRIDFDRIVVPGGVLTTESIETSIRDLHPAFLVDFEFHYYPWNSSSTKSKSNILNLKIKIRQGYSLSFSEGLLNQLARTIEQKLYIRAHTTYADGILNGTLIPIRIDPVRIFSKEASKRTHIIVH